MKAIAAKTLKSLVASTFLLMLPAQVHAWQPNAKDMETAIKTGDFTAYLENATTWLNAKAPAGAAPAGAALDALLKDPVFAATLDQRQLIAKIGAEPLAAFAKADPANQDFLVWLTGNTEAMDRFLEGSVPLRLAARDENSYAIATAPLETWKKILKADPDSKDGLYLRLAIAASLFPPGTGAPGAGQAKVQSDPVERYLHFKTAHKNKELFPSFDHLSVWELGKVTQSGGSNEDLAWARQMINAWRPDLRNQELVVNSTSEVWRRNSPIDFASSYKNVLAGGGKCGPRSSWSVFICQAFGIPAIGVGQPAHACVAYKSAFPMSEPQPGSAWKVGYGRGWQFSKLEGMGGIEFLDCVRDRADNAVFSKVEHLRWFAAALTNPAAASAIMEAARQAQQSVATVKTDVTASLKPEEAEKELTPEGKAGKETGGAAGPVKLSQGTTTIDAAMFSSMSGVRVLDCMSGGKQVNFDKNVESSWMEYTLDVPAAGTYSLVFKLAAANVEQLFEVKAGSGDPVTVAIPWTKGLWDKSPAVDIKLEKGIQTLRVTAKFQRAIAVRHLELVSTGK